MTTPRSLPRLQVLRHGETEWSLSGRHTSRTDLPLTPHGAEQGRRLGTRLREIKFTHVFTSPLLRARQTCELAGLAVSPVIEPELHEWDYGDFEGRTSAEIEAEHADWNLFVDGARGGESPADVAARAARFIARVQTLTGDIAVFSHGHFLRALAAVWTSMSVAHGQRFALEPTSWGILSHEHDRPDRPVIALWNQTDPIVAPR